MKVLDSEMSLVFYIEESAKMKLLFRPNGLIKSSFKKRFIVICNLCLNSVIIIGFFFSQVEYISVSPAMSV